VDATARFVIAALVLASLPGCRETGDGEPTSQPGPATDPPPAPTVITGAPGRSVFPDSWYFMGAKRPQKQKDIEERPAPPLLVTDWVGEPAYLERLRGKVVVVWFFATNRVAPMRGVERLKGLADRYRDRGVVFIGVHESGPAAANLAAAVETHAINFPVAVDMDGASVEAWGLGVWPMFALIDHQGNVRAAGLLTSKVEEALNKLIDLRDRDV
jgi:peroxiredoxin